MRGGFPMETRKEAYERKREELLKICTRCRKQNQFSITFERCDSCTTGRKLRMLEAEYRDVVGWGDHKNWGK